MFPDPRDDWFHWRVGRSAGDDVGAGWLVVWVVIAVFVLVSWLS